MNHFWRQPDDPFVDEQRAPEAELATEALERKIAQLEAELVAQKELTRKYAVKAHEAEVDIERAKQRIEREAARENERRRRGFLVGFLDVLDNLDRALEAARTVGDAAVVDGVALVRRDFLTKLAEYGVSRFESRGERFDPSRHEALSRVAVREPEHDGVVVGVVQEGYAIGNETLRPATVAVGRYVGASA